MVLNFFVTTSKDRFAWFKFLAGYSPAEFRWSQPGMIMLDCLSFQQRSNLCKLCSFAKNHDKNCGQGCSAKNGTSISSTFSSPTSAPKKDTATATSRSHICCSSSPSSPACS